MSGKALRLKRFRNSPNGGMVIIPLDHGVSLGPIPGLEYPESAIRMAVQEGADALVLHKGMLGFLEMMSGKLPGVFMHLSASSQLGFAIDHKVLIGSVEEALRRGADGVSLHVNLGNRSEPEMLQDLGIVGDACTNWQVPLLVMIYVRDAGGATTVPDSSLAYSARIAAELGADIIKMPIPEDFRTLKEITAALPVPVVVAGGSKVDDIPVFLDRMEKAMQAGVGGVAIGRNIFQNNDPRLILRAICSVVHWGYSSNTAWDEVKEDVPSKATAEI